MAGLVGLVASLAANPLGKDSPSQEPTISVVDLSEVLGVRWWRFELNDTEEGAQAEFAVAWERDGEILEKVSAACETLPGSTHLTIALSSQNPGWLRVHALGASRPFARLTDRRGAHVKYVGSVSGEMRVAPAGGGIIKTGNNRLTVGPPGPDELVLRVYVD